VVVLAVLLGPSLWRAVAVEQAWTQALVDRAGCDAVEDARIGGVAGVGAGEVGAVGVGLAPCDAAWCDAEGGSVEAYPY
jgi:hypothetical protein